MKKEARTYHILGGGLAGLCAAKFIKEKNKNNKVIVYEAAAHLGGRCFSFYDKTLQKEIDNATHVVLSANKEIRKLLKIKDWSSQSYYFDKGKINTHFWHYIGFILLSIFNTRACQIPYLSILKLLQKLFPFGSYKRKIYFSKGDLSKNLIEPLRRYADEIKLGWKLNSFQAKNDAIQKLIFNHGEVEINSEDQIICALDAQNYHKIFSGPKFEFNPITNIYYRTSVPLTLPKNIPFVATPKQTADWIFIIGDIVAVTISDSSQFEGIEDEELARKIWLEIREINGIKAAFVPPYKVLRHQRATIKQDKKNNDLRPKTAQSFYKNMRLAGDWTMKNWPCSLETTVLSAKRAIK